MLTDIYVVRIARPWVLSADPSRFARRIGPYNDLRMSTSGKPCGVFANTPELRSLAQTWTPVWRLIAVNRFILSLVGWGLLSLAASPLWAARPADTLLPASTQAFVSVANYAELEAAFNRTSFGRLLNDPIMRPFRDDLHRQLNEKGSQLKDAIGVSLQDLEKLATGEIGVALVKNAQGLARTAAVVDVTQNLPGAQELLAQVDTHLVQKRGAMRRDLNHQGIALRVNDVPAAGPGKQPTQGVYFFLEGQLASPTT